MWHIVFAHDVIMVWFVKAILQAVNLVVSLKSLQNVHLFQIHKQWKACIKLILTSI